MKQRDEEKEDLCITNTCATDGHSAFVFRRKGLLILFLSLEEAHIFLFGFQVSTGS